ncbi:discoidin domain-containing protein, partial [bacterium]|nr:discoidin domain-containing protein [bacterium]
YKEPDQELVDASVRVYIAIANNLAEEDKDRAIKMLNNSFSLTKDITLRYMAISSLKDLGTAPGKEFEENNFVDHKGCGKEVKLTYPYSDLYPAGGDLALADGIKGTKDRNDGNWQGFLGDDLEAIIALNEAIAIEKISVNFSQNIGAMIFLPVSVEFAISEDGKNFKILSTHENDVSPKQEGALIKEFTTDFNKTNARYVRVKAKSVGVCPAWHSRAGRKSWLLIDEVIIN